MAIPTISTGAGFLWGMQGVAAGVCVWAFCSATVSFVLSHRVAKMQNVGIPLIVMMSKYIFAMVGGVMVSTFFSGVLLPIVVAGLCYVGFLLVLRDPVYQLAWSLTKNGI